jgi:hypothetical protein
MLLFVFFEVAHIEILLIAALDFAEIFLPSFLVLEMYLHVLLQIGRGGEGFAAFLADKRFLLGVDAFVPVQVRLLVEPLLALLVITFVGFGASVSEPMSL